MASCQKAPELKNLRNWHGAWGARAPLSNNRAILWTSTPNEFSNLERNVFLISRHIGLLREDEFFSDFEKEGTLIHESLEHWINAARDIQTIFSDLEVSR